MYFYVAVVAVAVVDVVALDRARLRKTCKNVKVPATTAIAEKPATSLTRND